MKVGPPQKKTTGEFSEVGSPKTTMGEFNEVGSFLPNSEFQLKSLVKLGPYKFETSTGEFGEVGSPRFKLQLGSLVKLGQG